MTNLVTGSILFGKLITHTNKNDEEVTSSIVRIKQVDGTVSQGLTLRRYSFYAEA